jgi:two-component system invasion response regulator UvrY
MLRICIADDHAIVRKGLKQILSETADLVVADEAATGQELLNKVAKGRFDVVLLDISMPGRNGLEILKELRAERPKLPVLILSIYPEEQYAVRALKSGAAGYLTKESAPEELIAAIRRISQGKKYVTASLAEKLAAYLETDLEKPPHESMSNREFSILCMIGAGKSVSEIAGDLRLSVKTISTYRGRILKKLGLKNNAEIMKYAIRNGLTE